MRHKLIAALAVLVLLGGCHRAVAPTVMPTPTATPTAIPTPEPTPTPAPSEEPTELWGFPIDDTHDAFEVDTGGKLGTVLVTVEQEQSDNLELGDSLFSFSVWRADDLTTPIQTMKAESWGSFHGHEVLDINFDGYMDFRYQRSWGTGGFFFYCWVWDEDTLQFAAVPQLTEYGDVYFDSEAKNILARRSMKLYADLDNDEDIYVWENKEPVCVRRIKQVPRLETDGTFTHTITVFDCVNDKFIEVYSAQYTEDDFSDEWELWYDLSYHG